jgi:hypothetical protein
MALSGTRRRPADTALHEISAATMAHLVISLLPGPKRT